MKKLLGILLTTVMVCTSMGVLGAGTEDKTVPVSSNVVWTYGAEEKEGLLWYPQGNGTNGYIKSVPASENIPVCPGSEGTHYLEISDNADVKGAQIFDAHDKFPIIEANTHYRLSFWFYTNSGAPTPAMVFSYTGAKMDPYGANKNVFPLGKQNGWKLYEIDFVTASNLESGKKIKITLRSNDSLLYLYDDFKLEKVSGADIRFVKEMSVTDIATIRSNSTLKTRTTAAADYTADYEGKNASVYPMCIVGDDASVFTDVKKVVSTYIPKTVGESTTLCVAIYEKSGKLKDIIIKPKTYEFQKSMTNETIDYYYLADDRFTIVDIDASLYPNCYMKAFMWSSIADMSAISEAATLPAVRPAA